MAMADGVIALRPTPPPHGLARPVEVLLIELEAERGDADLALMVADIVVGCLCIRGGVVTHAELPGAEGDPALQMVPELFGLRARAEPPTSERRTVQIGWRSVYEEDDRRLRPSSACTVLEVTKPVEAAVALEARHRGEFSRREYRFAKGS